MLDHPPRKDLLHVLGLGLDFTQLPPAYLDLLHQADVIAGGQRMLQAFAQLPARKIQVKAPLSQMVQELKQALQNQELTLVLADGDPLLYGLGSTLLKHLPRHSLRFYPNVSSLQAAASRLGMPWQDIPIHSLHGRNDLLPALRSVSWHGQAALFTDQSSSPDNLAKELISLGAKDLQLVVCEDLCSPEEKIETLDLQQAAAKSFSQLNFVFLRRTREPEIRPCQGLEDDCFAHHKGLITKKEIRSLGLGQLQIQPTDTVWDLGAGCGSVAIEACCLAWQGRVHAVERDAERCALIHENIRRTGTYFLQVHNMAISQALEDLPAPERIFLGGGLNQEPEILAGLWERLPASGRLVAHVVLLGSLQRILDFCRERGIQPGLIQAQISRGSSLQNDLRLAAQNPVYIVTLEKRNQEGHQNQGTKNLSSLA
ncbi:MAG: precorrin-6y C5,15-methyltransferase (decarboxylating) subunit CbiE [Desulfohalobiaceae bacterium]